MPKVSVIILTKNRASLLKQALSSVRQQSFKDLEVVVINDGSTDRTNEVIKELQAPDLSINYIVHEQSLGIIASRQQALEASLGEYVAILDDDDQWQDADKLKKQVEFLNSNPNYVLVGGGMAVLVIPGKMVAKFRPATDEQIRNTMLLKNNFFTSTVMFRKAEAIKAGGFISDGVDLAEDYDLWLRLGHLGKMHNLPGVFTLYAQSSYNKEKLQAFLNKQLRLINRERSNYSGFWLANLILRARLLL